MSLGDPQATIVFWKSKEVLSALGGIASSTGTLYHAAKEKDFQLALASIGTIASLGYWLYTRLKRGANPADPAPRVTLTQVPKP